MFDHQKDGQKDMIAIQTVGHHHFLLRMAQVCFFHLQCA